MNRYIAFSLLSLVSASVTGQAQESFAVIGTWNGCFLADGYRALACGRVVLDSSHACRGFGDGYYEIAFDSLVSITDSGTGRIRPTTQDAFTWTLVAPDSIRFSRKVYPAHNTEGQPICPIGDATGFEAGGSVSRDSLKGTWVWYADDGGTHFSGTFALTRLR